jgi:RND family efflux transporter MFP subunit
MKSFNYLLLALTVIMAACSSQGDEKGNVDKKAELEKARTELAALKSKVSQLEKELEASDPTSIAKGAKVITLSVTPGLFEHQTEVRGSVESRKNVSLGSSMGGEIRRVLVKEGQRVSKGQSLIELNADVVKNTLAEMKTGYELAKVIFERQEKLWKQNIGTEMQYLQAKSGKETFENRIASTQAQLDQLIITAPFSGLIDKVDALEGQTAGPGVPLIRMVTSEDLYVKADVSEDFIGRVKVGDGTEVMITSQNSVLKSAVSSVGQVINPENRTFALEVRLPNGLSVKPNQVAVIRFVDYRNSSAISIPTKYIQRDNKGVYVYTMTEQRKAVRTYIQTGISYAGKTEIKEGLSAGQVVIGEGFREVADGMEVTPVL